MTFLAIDSSQNYGSVALMREGELIYESFFQIGVTHSETLMPQIDHALRFSKVDKNDLAAILLCHGPGSFTGLRIGMASAKGIAYGLKIPVIAFNSLELTAVNLYGCGRNILSVLDAKMKEVYLAMYDQHLSVLIPPMVCTPIDIPDPPSGEFYLTGSAATILSPLLDERGIKHQTAVPHQGRIRASMLFVLQSLQTQAMDFDLIRLADLEPLYLRESTAQTKKLRDQ